MGTRVRLRFSKFTRVRLYRKANFALLSSCHASCHVDCVLAFRTGVLITISIINSPTQSQALLGFFIRSQTSTLLLYVLILIFKPSPEKCAKFVQLGDSNL
ncbi:MAG: hypothetical protein ACTSRL_22930 [Candidatus Helarchaeota archaeon]